LKGLHLGEEDWLEVSISLCQTEKGSCSHMFALLGNEVWETTQDSLSMPKIYSILFLKAYQEHG
jgi:hypothetical protein